MGEKVEIAPDPLDHAGLASDQGGAERTAEEFDDRVAPAPIV